MIKYDRISRYLVCIFPKKNGSADEQQLMWLLCNIFMRSQGTMLIKVSKVKSHWRFINNIIILVLCTRQGGHELPFNVTYRSLHPVTSTYLCNYSLGVTFFFFVKYLPKEQGVASCPNGKQSHVAFLFWCVYSVCMAFKMRPNNCIFLVPPLSRMNLKRSSRSELSKMQSVPLASSVL